MANNKKSSSKKQKLPKDIIYIAIIAVLVVALLVVIFAGDKLSMFAPQDNVGNNNVDNVGTGNANGAEEDIKVYTSVLSGKGNISLPTEFDGNSCLEVHFIDIGQGDAIAIMFPDGKKMLIDAGSGTSVSDETRDKYLTYLSDNLNLQADDSIDYLLVTHPDSDHVNMVSSVLEKYDVDNIYYNDYSYNSSITKVYSTFMTNAVAEPEAKLYAIGKDSHTYTVSGENYSMNIYAPGYQQFYEEAYEGKNRNILSIMCVLDYGGRKIMFTGDAEVPTEEWFMQTVGGTLMDVDVLKVGHHGSYSCTSTAFLDYIKPEYAVISCGDGNSYHHPHPETMNTLFEYGIVTYRTDRHGSTVLYVADDGDFGFLPEKYVPVENNTKDINPLTIKLKEEENA